MVDISIIMPVYNSEKYIGHTIESILAQSQKNFELILVDDGSKDSSGAICDRYAAKDERIKVIHKENQGICATRNRGLAEAVGRYIAFCDNDDEFLEGLLKDNLQLADRYDADVVRFSRRKTVIKGDKVMSVSETKGFQDCFIANDQFGEYYDQINLAGEGVWSGIYKKAFLDEHQIRFNEDMKYGYEDLYFVTEVYLHEPSIVLNTKVYYNWIMRYQHSTSGKTNINNIEALRSGLELKEKLIHKYEIEDKIPHIWLQELSLKIYAIVKYVSPKKVKLPLRDRIHAIKCLADTEVFRNANKKKCVKALKEKAGTRSFLVYDLFVKKQYRLLYFMVIGKQYLSE